MLSGLRAPDSNPGVHLQKSVSQLRPSIGGLVSIGGCVSALSGHGNEGQLAVSGEEVARGLNPGGKYISIRICLLVINHLNW